MGISGKVIEEARLRSEEKHRNDSREEVVALLRRIDPTFQEESSPDTSSKGKSRKSKNHHKKSKQEVV